VERDPICGMTVDPERAAAREEHSGKTFYFCCAGCANKFRAEPEKYLSAKAPVGANRETALIQLGGVKGATGQSSADRASAASAAARAPILTAEKARGPETSHTKPTVSPNDYTCPMDPEVHQDRPGACPKCGMALELTLPAVGRTRVEYTCPMHPEIVRSEPGS
jgi:Cu+-exporting ATPase